MKYGKLTALPLFLGAHHTQKNFIFLHLIICCLTLVGMNLFQLCALKDWWVLLGLDVAGLKVIFSRNLHLRCSKLFAAFPFMIWKSLVAFDTHHGLSRDGTNCHVFGRWVSDGGLFLCASISLMLLAFGFIQEYRNASGVTFLLQQSLTYTLY